MNYIPIDKGSVPERVRFDVPPQCQGQIVEVAFGGLDRSEHAEGAPYKRVIDRSDGATAYYALVER